MARTHAVERTPLVADAMVVPGNAEPGEVEKTEAAEPDLAGLRRKFEEARDMTADARKLSERDRAYFDDFNDDQWSDTEKAALKRRKQPIMTYNLVKVAINGMLGVVERMQTDPKALPRYEDKEGVAEVATKSLRFIADQTRLDRLKVKAARNFFVEGVCAAIVGVEKDPIDAKVTCIRIPWEEQFADPYSKEEDYLDAAFMGMARWTDLSVLKKRYKDKAEQLASGMDGSGMVDSTGEDRPWSGWMDRKRKRMLLVEMYYNDGEGWERAIFTAGLVLEHGPSPYVDDQGQPVNPIVMQSYAKSRDNYAFGAVRSMISPQDGYNKRQSKLLHMLSTRQTYGNKSALGDDVAKVRQEMAKPDGHIELMHGQFGVDFGVIPVTDQIAGQFQLLQEDRAQLDRLLPNPGILGRDTQGQSGVAIQSAQNAGMTELAEAYGGLTDWELRIYRQMWFRAKQFWTKQRWVRVTDDIGAIEHTQINVPVVDEMGFPVMDPQTGQPAMQNSIAELDVDIILDAQPESATLQTEQFSIMAELAKSGLQIPPMALIQLSALNGKNKQQAIEAIQQSMQAPPPPREQAETGLKNAQARLNAAKAVGEELKSGVTVGMAEAGGPPPIN